MSIQAISWVLDHSKATYGERLVLLALAGHADKHGLEAYPSVSAIAQDANMSERQVYRCLSRLEEAGEIVKTGRRKNWRGKPTTVWAIPGVPKPESMSVVALVQNLTSAPSKPDKSSRKTCHMRHNPHTPLKEGTVLNRPEPSGKGGVGGEPVGQIPEALDTPAFRDAWGRWAKFRREDRHALTPSTAAAQLKKLAKVGSEAAVAMIDQSIEHGWQGLFPVDKRRNGTAKGETLADHDRRLAAEEAARSARAH